MTRRILKAICMVSMLSAGGYAAAADDGAQTKPGYGMGPGMMGGGYGMGSGMMGGGYGMGPGMMGSGYGMGSGMMGGGMGPGMMMGGWGFSLSGALNLNEDQQKKIQKIQEDFGKRQWTLMQAMHDAMTAANKKYGDSDDIDVDAVMKTQTEMTNAHLQMTRNRLEAQKQIRAILTKEQREKLNEISRWGWQ